MAIQSSVGRLCTAWNSCKNLLNNRNSFINCQPTVALFSKHQINELTEKIKNLNIPAKPKRPLTPYFKFMTTSRSETRAKFPEKSPTDIVRALAEQWETVDENVKQKFQQEYQIEQKDYAKKMLAFDATLTDEQRKILVDLKKAISERNVKIKEKIVARKLGKPKRAPPAFAFYMSEMMKERGSLGFKEFQLKMAEQWKALTTEQRQPYQLKFEGRRAAYQLEIENWEQQMIKEGRTNLVRKSWSLYPASRTNEKRKVPKE